MARGMPRPYVITPQEAGDLAAMATTQQGDPFAVKRRTREALVGIGDRLLADSRRPAFTGGR